MPVLYVEFDNIFCFTGFKANFTYPKKLVRSSLENECLLDYPNIRYRKLNVLLGSNGTGKTCLGKALHRTFIFLDKHEQNSIMEAISDPNKEASILIDLATPQGLFMRYEIKAIPGESGLHLRYREAKINRIDTYETLVAKLPTDIPFEKNPLAFSEKGIKSWNYSFPTVEGLGVDRLCFGPFKEKEKKVFCDILFRLLKTFDPSVTGVSPSQEMEDTFLIALSGGKTIGITNGDKLIDVPLLSSGTKYAVNIAFLIYKIKTGTNGFYFADEQFCFVNADLEVGCLALMSELLGDGDQLFFTTHNEEILAMPFPNHSFNFLKKEVAGSGVKIELINAGDMEKRNNVNVKNLYQNDFFRTLPDISLLMGIEK